MGAVTFSLDLRLVAALRSAQPFSLFIETGTFHGDTIAEVYAHFDRTISIELSKKLWDEAVARFKSRDEVEILHGNSADCLRNLRQVFATRSTLFWLDAHWCLSEGAAGEQSQCPLLGELDAVGALNSSSVILIDDARLFLCPPPAPHEISQWPRFDQIVQKLRDASEDHEIMVVNDVIVFFPSKMRRALEQYAVSCGVDWLAASHALSQHDLIVADQSAKEVVIRELAKQVEEQASLLNASIKSREAAAQEEAKQMAAQASHAKETAVRQLTEQMEAQANSADAELKAKDAVIEELRMELELTKTSHNTSLVRRTIKRLRGERS